MNTVQERDSKKVSNIIVNISTIIGAALGVLYILILLAAFNVLSLPLITDNFSAFVGLAIFGLAMCMTVYPIRASLQKDFKWLSVLTISAIILGTLAGAEVILVILADQGIIAGIPGITTYPNAFIIFSVIVFVKWISATAHLFIKF
ncbi:MAG: hypothetical protein H7641_14940 [Candidatus Heimdallarchaeota archaeon]|nr:hypothetical protein [Candidatus Heimdallarchaeota archaeon]MCK4878859.1 hypothetical protein [Candidatus Heimdallarchaeota archaeon]